MARLHTRDSIIRIIRIALIKLIGKAPIIAQHRHLATMQVKLIIYTFILLMHTTQLRKLLHQTYNITHRIIRIMRSMTIHTITVHTHTRIIHTCRHSTAQIRLLIQTRYR